MERVTHEMQRLWDALQAEPVDTERWKRLYAARQALAWTQNPNLAAAPLGYINNECDDADPEASTRSPV